MIAVLFAVFSTSAISYDQTLRENKEFGAIKHKLVQFVLDIPWDQIVTQLLYDFITGRWL